MTTIRILGETELESVFALRSAVWADFASDLERVPAWLMRDGFDASAVHWGAFSGNELVGAARLSRVATLAALRTHEMYSSLLLRPEFPLCIMERLVVRRDFAGQGIARRLDRHRIERARSLGAREILVGVPHRRVSRLLELGFSGFARTHDGFAGSALEPPTLLRMSIEAPAEAEACLAHA